MKAKLKQILFTVKDYTGQKWNVAKELEWPAEYGGPLLWGYLPRRKGEPAQKGPPRLIITTALRDYLERNRMTHSALIRLPLKRGRIIKLRGRLGMHYFRDLQHEWMLSKQQALKATGRGGIGDQPVHPRSAWTKKDLARLVKMAEAGKNTPEIAKALNKTFA